jgi:hypothetical protein
MIKPAVLIVMAATTASPSKEGTIVAIVVIVSAVLLALNSIGILPRGKTAESLKLDLDVSEKRLKQALERLEDQEHKISRLESRPDLQAISHLLVEHDKRMMVVAAEISETLAKVAVAVVPPELIRDD